VSTSCKYRAVDVLLEVLRYSSSPYSSLLVVEDAGELVLLEDLKYSSRLSSCLLVVEDVGELLLREILEHASSLSPSLTRRRGVF